MMMAQRPTDRPLLGIHHTPSAYDHNRHEAGSFNAGPTQTFPLFIFGATRQGVPAEVNVLATMLLVVVLALMGVNALVQRALSRRDAARTAA
jgi:hypothetical protein